MINEWRQKKTKVSLTPSSILFPNFNFERKLLVLGNEGIDNRLLAIEVGWLEEEMTEERIRTVLGKRTSLKGMSKGMVY